MLAATGVAASPGDTQMSRETAGPRPDGGPTGGPEGGSEGDGAEELGTEGADGAESAPRVSFRLPETTGAAASTSDAQRSREMAGPRPDGGPAGGPEGGAEGGGAEALGAARIGREPTPHGSSRLPAATGNPPSIFQVHRTNRSLRFRCSSRGARLTSRTSAPLRSSTVQTVSSAPITSFPLARRR